MRRLFVYGTLRRGYSNARELEGAAFERLAATVAGYALCCVSGYPALTTCADGVVYGELYSVTDEHLVRLDAFEEVPHRYLRSPILLEDGTEADAYVLPPGAAALETIEGGEYFE